MRKNLLTLLLIFGSALLGNQPAFSCSSFAVYADKPFYGMNFDYDKFPMRFNIVDEGGLKSFHLSFERPLGDKSVWAYTGGMNSNGLFGALQEEYPIHKNQSMPGKNRIYLHQLYEGLFKFEKVQSIESICREKKLTQLKAVSIHSLFADAGGQAFVAEAGDNRNYLIKIKDRFIVMTNFPNRSLIGKSYKEAKGKGDYRYIKGYHYLKENSDSFNAEKGMHLLSLMKNNDPKYPTCCSMLFVPSEKTIYVSLFTNYDKVFKVSLEDATITTFKGFSKSVEFKIDQNGLAISKLAIL